MGAIIQLFAKAKLSSFPRPLRSRALGQGKKMMNIKNMIFYILTVLFAASLFAQNVNPELTFYPLQNGNYWEYCETHTKATVIEKKVYYCLEVVGDTVLSNNLQYKIILKRYIPDTAGPSISFERIDSTTGNVYRFSDGLSHNNERKEYLIDSLYSQLGDTSKAFRNDFPFTTLLKNSKTTFLDSGIDSLFGENALYKDLYFVAAIPGFHYRLVKDVGLVRYVDSGEIIYIDTRLKYANIQGTEFGERNNVKVHHSSDLVDKIYLYQNYPNPFNSKTNIYYRISYRSTVDLNIYNILGERILTYSRINNVPGMHYFSLSGEQLPSGTYIYEIRAGTSVLRKQLSLIK